MGPPIPDLPGPLPEGCSHGAYPAPHSIAGCSQGANSIAPVKTILRAVHDFRDGTAVAPYATGVAMPSDASLHPSSVLVFHEDVPNQDWSSLFGVLEGEGSYINLPPPPIVNLPPSPTAGGHGGDSGLGAAAGDSEMPPGLAGAETGGELVDAAAAAAQPRLPVFCAAIGRSFHHRLLPDRSLHIAFR